MVEIQRLASRIVGRVLAGRSLDAELAALWVRHPQLAERERAAVQGISARNFVDVGTRFAFSLPITSGSRKIPITPKTAP